jgi:hypothetical protein
VRIQCRATGRRPVSRVGRIDAIKPLSRSVPGPSSRGAWPFPLHYQQERQGSWWPSVPTQNNPNTQKSPTLSKQSQRVQQEASPSVSRNKAAGYARWMKFSPPRLATRLSDVSAQLCRKCALIVLVSRFRAGLLRLRGGWTGTVTL